MFDPSALLLSVGREEEQREKDAVAARAAERARLAAERAREQEQERERERDEYDRGLDRMLEGMGDGADGDGGGDDGGEHPGGGDQQQQQQAEAQQAHAQELEQEQLRHRPEPLSASERQALDALETWTEDERKRDEARQREREDRAEQERLEAERVRRAAVARSQRSRSANVKTAASDLLISLERQLFPPMPKASAKNAEAIEKALEEGRAGARAQSPSSSSPTSPPQGLQSITAIDVEAAHPLSPAGLMEAAQRWRGTAGRWMLYRAGALVAGALLVALYLLVWVEEEEISPADRVSDKTIGHTS